MNHFPINEMSIFSKRENKVDNKRRNLRSLSLSNRIEDNTDKLESDCTNVNNVKFNPKRIRIKDERISCNYLYPEDKHLINHLLKLTTNKMKRKTSPLSGIIDQKSYLQISKNDFNHNTENENEKPSILFSRM